MKFIFFILMFVTFAAQAWEPATDCRANIANVVCKVSSLSDGFEDQVRCQRLDRRYITDLEQLYDDMPEKMKPGSCHLRRIVLFDNSNQVPTGMATAFTEKQVVNGREMKVNNGLLLFLNRGRIFDSGFSVSEWFNRRDRLPFGIRFSEPLTEGPKQNFVVNNVRANPMLLYVVMHEFGHYLHAANENVIQVEDAHCYRDGVWQVGCKPIYSGAWTDISWLNGEIRPETHFFDPMPCMMGCEPNQVLAWSRQAELYRAFANSDDFTSYYALLQPNEDFSESLAQYLLAKHFGFQHTIQLSDNPGDVVDMTTRTQSGLLAEKKRFLEDFETREWKWEVKTAEAVSTPRP